MEKRELKDHLEFVRKSINELDRKISAMDKGNPSRNIRDDFDMETIYWQYVRLRSGLQSLLRRDYDCEKENERENDYEQPQ